MGIERAWLARQAYCSYCIRETLISIPIPNKYTGTQLKIYDLPIPIPIPIPLPKCSYFNLLHYLNMSILGKIQHFANNKQENMQ